MTIDPELKYCPKCNDEYRSDIENCAGCNVPLITGAQRLAIEEERQRKIAGRSTTLSINDDLVTIHRGTLHDAKRLEVLMADERIGTLLAGDDNSCGKGCCPSYFDLKVRREDAADAMKIIDEEFRRSTGIDAHEMGDHADAVFNPHAAEAVCPACGTKFPTATTTCPDCGLCFG